MSWSFFSHHFYSHAGNLTIIFLACYIFAMSLCFPANPSSQSWPCQRDRDVRTLLSEALIKSQTLEGKISALHSNMVNFNRRYLLSLILLFVVLPVFLTRVQHDWNDNILLLIIAVQTMATKPFQCNQHRIFWASTKR